jgi:hypothetical protein
MRLAFTHKEARKEYLSFLAGFPDALVSEEQKERWNSGHDGKMTSLASMKHRNAGGKDIDAFNKHLRWWKVDEKYWFYPSFNLWKYLTVDLGYACARTQDASDLPTDLMSLPQPRPLVPNFIPTHNNPEPKMPVMHADGSIEYTGSLTFYKHFNLYGERIDINPIAKYNQNNPLSHASVTSPNHSKNQKNRVQPPEPVAFEEIFVPQQVADHADDRQKLFYQVCYPDGQPDLTPEERLQLLQQRLQSVKAELEEAQITQRHHDWLMERLGYTVGGARMDQLLADAEALSAPYAYGGGIELRIRELQDEQRLLQGQQ